MPVSKLTLSAEADLIQDAKQLAAQEGTSVSGLFCRLVRAMKRARMHERTLPPLTRKATGLVKLPGNQPDDRLIERALARKYRIRK